jgi:outer membrane lipoprotein-sorting protein
MTTLPIRRRTATLVLACAFIGSFVAVPAAEAAPSAREIMDKVALTRKLDGSEAIVKMTIADDKGGSRERKLSVATKLFDGGKTEKRIYRFMEPADVKGTGVLVFDYEAQADDVWIFLPALRKTRRIVSSQRSQSFMGSEFSYGDLNVPALDDYTYALGAEENVGGESCYVIEATPKDKAIAESEGYSKKTYWVSKDKFVVRKGQFYDMAGKLLKELICDDVKLLDAKNKRFRPMKMEMLNKQNGRRSTFTSEKVAFAPETKDDYFTTRYLEQS